MGQVMSRRQLLRIGALGAIGMLAACSPAAAPTTTPAAQTVAPTVPAATPAAAVATPSAVPTAAPAPTTAAATTQAAAPAATGQSPLIAAIADAARQWQNTLSDAQRAQSTFPYADAERLRWHWTNTSAFPRNGLALRDMQSPQREAALALLRASVSEAGFKKSVDIMQLQPEISGDPDNYYVSVFGAPGDTLWGWRFEGHHLSRHFSMAGDKIAITPFFHGVWPSVSAAGERIMRREEWAARELMRSLDEARRAEVIFQRNALSRHVTWNDNYVQPLEPVGVPLAALTYDQQALAMEVLQTWMGTQAESIAREHLDRIAAAGPDNIRFGWAGALDERRPHYYRIQGPSFLLEYDNTRNGAIHIHSVWRVFDQDFGQGL